MYLCQTKRFCKTEISCKFCDFHSFYVMENHKTKRAARFVKPGDLNLFHKKFLLGSGFEQKVHKTIQNV